MKILSTPSLLAQAISIPLIIAKEVAAWVSKLKALIRALIDFVYRNRKTILLLLLVSVATIVLSSVISILLYKTHKTYLPTLGNIHTTGVQAYSDPTLQNLTQNIQWGMVYPGAQKNVTLYLKSISNVNTTFEKQETNWTFTNSTDMIIPHPSDTTYMNLTWDYNNASVSPKEVVKVSLTLTVEDSLSFIQFIIDNDIEQFSFDIIIVAKEKPS